MMGGGYVVSGEVARVLVGVHARMRLKFTPIEDATLGFWLMAMDLRHVDHPRFYTWAAPCCFRAPVRCEGRGSGGRAGGLGGGVGGRGWGGPAGAHGLQEQAAPPLTRSTTHPRSLAGGQGSGWCRASS